MEKHEELEAAAAHALRAMATINKSVLREERGDAAFRASSPQWKGTLSPTLNVDIMPSNLYMRKAFSSARSSDGQAQTEIEDASRFSQDF